MLRPVLTKNDSRARILIITVSVIVFLAVVALGRIEWKPDLDFDIHIFATINAFINAAVAVLLVAGLVSVKQKKFRLHKRIMITAMVLSVLFLISYILHHLFAGSTLFGDVNGDGMVSAEELAVVGNTRVVYFIILITHIFLAAIILPFILFTAYRALISEWPRHKKLAKITWPVWFYVAVTGPLIYLMISPYY
jgi:putative membrane protein